MRMQRVFVKTGPLPFSQEKAKRLIKCSSRLAIRTKKLHTANAQAPGIKAAEKPTRTASNGRAIGALGRLPPRLPV